MSANSRNAFLLPSSNSYRVLVVRHAVTPLTSCTMILAARRVCSHSLGAIRGPREPFAQGGNCSWFRSQGLPTVAQHWWAIQ